MGMEGEHKETSKSRLKKKATEKTLDTRGALECIGAPERQEMRKRNSNLNVEVDQRAIEEEEGQEQEPPQSVGRKEQHKEKKRRTRVEEEHQKAIVDEDEPYKGCESGDHRDGEGKKVKKSKVSSSAEASEYYGDNPDKCSGLEKNAKDKEKSKKNNALLSEETCIYKHCDAKIPAANSSDSAYNEQNEVHGDGEGKKWKKSKVSRSGEALEHNGNSPDNCPGLEKNANVNGSGDRVGDARKNKKKDEKSKKNNSLLSEEMCVNEHGDVEIPAVNGNDSAYSVQHEAHGDGEGSEGKKVKKSKVSCPAEASEHNGDNPDDCLGLEKNANVKGSVDRMGDVRKGKKKDRDKSKKNNTLVSEEICIIERSDVKILAVNGDDSSHNEQNEVQGKKNKEEKKRRSSTELEKDESHASKKLKKDGANVVVSNVCSSNEKKKTANKMNTDGVSSEGISIEEPNDKGKLKGKASTKKKKKRVRFSREVDVFPLGKDYDGGLVRGRWFTKEEDKIVLEAINKYIEANQLGDKGKEMILNCLKYRQVRGCWKEIGACLPYRPYSSIAYRAHVLLERSMERKWEPEEYDAIKRFHAQHGPDWKTLADELGKHRIHVKDAWRRIKLPNARRGQWSQEEYQTLFDLVNLDLRLKAFEEKKTKHGMLRENISWEAISEKMATRRQHNCCVKWYYQLSSSLVMQGLWSDADDYRLLPALQDLDAACIEDVDWDSLLERRSGDVCRKRWSQMIRHIGDYKERPFIEQVEVLLKRYCPEMFDYRK